VLDYGGVLGMTNQEILTKAIQKAIDSGWDDILPTETWRVVTDRGLEVDIDTVSPYTGNRIGGRYNYMEIIFNHDFAKALWDKGKTVYRAEVIESPAEGEAGYDEYLEAWEYHLQQMAIANDPINYLGNNI
jgi:hypothetical protein